MPADLKPLTRLREILAAGDVTLDDHGLPASMCVDLIEDEVAALRARVAELEAAVARVDQWSHEYGAALVPTGVDTFGEGMRAAKRQVGRLLSPTGDDHG